MTAIQLARFGNKSGAHDVLDHSGIDNEVLTAIVWRTDSPPFSEGLGLEPFVSAYKLGNHYIVQVTSSDPEAGRAGMVETTTAIVPLPEVATLDLHRLWQHLSTRISVTSPLESTDFAFAPNGPHTHAAGARAAASAVLTTGRVVWTGDGFEEAVDCLWLHLRSRDRNRLVVGAAAHPDRISVPTNADSLEFVKTVVSALPRWSQWVTAMEESPETDDPVRDALFGDDAGLAEEFADKLSVEQVEFAIWRHLPTAAALFDRLPSLSHESTRGLIQLLGLIQPDPTRGTEVKAAALSRLQNLTARSSFADIRGLRGLPWSALHAGAQVELLNTWTNETISDPARSEDVLVAIRAVANEAGDPFMSDLSVAMSSSLDVADVDHLTSASLQSASGDGVLGWMVKTCSAKVVDSAIAATITSGGGAPPWLQVTSRVQRLPQAHALSVPIDDPVAAWEAQAALHPRSTTADDLLAVRTGDQGVVSAALALDDNKLLDRAAKLASADDTLLSGGSVEDDRFRALWFAVADAGGDPWASVRPSEAAVPLLDLLVAGQPVELSVLVSLSKTTSADISTYKLRASIWSLLPPAAVDGFKEATAQTIARSCKAGDPAIEQPLVAAVLSPDLLATVSKESATQALVLLSTIAVANSSHANIVIEYGRFTRPEQTVLGNLIRARRWRTAAETIANLSATRTDLANAADIVSSMFGLVERLSRFMNSGSRGRPEVTSAEMLDALTDVAARLYKEGPMTEALWERAGGDAADLVTGGTGRLAWGKALQSALSGRRGAPSVPNLLATMLEDYPMNNELLTLRKMTKNGSPG